MSEIAKLAAGLEQLVAQMSAAGKVADSGTAARLQELSGQLREQHALFAADHAKVSAAQKAKLAQSKQDLESLKQQSAKARQELKAAQEAAAKKKPAPPPPPAPPPIDPELARKTRVELLQRFGGLEPSQASHADWELWNQLGEWK